MPPEHSPGDRALIDSLTHGILMDFAKTIYRPSTLVPTRNSSRGIRNEVLDLCSDSEMEVEDRLEDFGGISAPSPATAMPPARTRERKKLPPKIRYSASLAMTIPKTREHISDELEVLKRQKEVDARMKELRLAQKWQMGRVSRRAHAGGRVKSQSISGRSPIGSESVLNDSEGFVPNDIFELPSATPDTSPAKGPEAGNSMDLTDGLAMYTDIHASDAADVDA
ncbi:hypothetical protein C8F01DRAFT_1374059 [Mycena amicta]|nr:hypothetical protein C8F01DRAFT_1374059 [Mycena amicta]